MKQGDRAIAFIAFGHEKFAARVPVRVRPENRDLGADVMRRMQPAFAQNVRGHRRRRGFTVHSGDEDSAFADMIAASASARRTVLLPLSWTLFRIGLSFLIAEE